MQPLISPPRHQFGPCLPAPRLFVPRLPRCGCRLPLLLSPRLPRCGCLSLLLSPRLPRCGCPATAAFGYRGTARTALSPAWSEMPPRTASLLQFCPEHHHPEAPHGLRMFSCPAGSTDTARASFAVLPGAPTVRSSPPPSCPETRPAPLLLFCPGPPSRRPRHKKRRTEPHRGPSAAKKQPICRGSITAAALQPVRSVHAPETDPLRIVRAGISG